MAIKTRARAGMLLLTGTILSACAGGMDLDMRRFGNTLNTSDAAIAARTQPRPQADNRGVISYPNYQVAVARTGDTVNSIAARLGIPAAELARYNALTPDATLLPGELIALPGRVAEPSPATGAVTSGPIQPSSTISVATIAGSAINRAESGTSTSATPPRQIGSEPQRHRVAAGETAYSISRRYGVSVDALAEWNGLGPNRTVRVDQILLIPPVDTSRPAPAAPATPVPGQGSPTPVPPSAAQPLPQETVARNPETPKAPDLGSGATSASDTTRLLTPVAGRIVRPYAKGRNDGIDIAASAGTSVRAADKGTVAAITRDTDGVPIVVIRHENNLLTVYAGVDNLKVDKGATVSRGQTIASIRQADPAVLHFEVREGFESVDPGPYLN